MSISSVPVDQSAFTRVMVVSIEPKMEVKFDQETRERQETGLQATTKNGLSQWTVQVVISMPSQFDGRTQSEVVPVTVTRAEDPSSEVMEGEQVEFIGLTVGVMEPEVDQKSGKARGGRLFWRASGVVSRSMAGKP